MTMPDGMVQVGARINDEWILTVKLKNQLPAEYNRSDVIRFALAMASGMDRFDSMREAESVGRRELTAKPEDNGYTAVTGIVDESVLANAMEKLGTNNRSYAVRHALASAARIPDAEAMADRGKPGPKHRN